MIKNILFLTAEFKQMIEDSGLGLDSLLPQNRSSHFCRDDLYEIDYMTMKAREDGGILAFYGFGFGNSMEAELQSSRLIVPKADIDTHMQAFDFRTTPLDACCVDQDTIILWQQERNEEATNLMFKANLKAILKAMARVLPYEKVLASQQFELAILRD